MLAGKGWTEEEEPGKEKVKCMAGGAWLRLHYTMNIVKDQASKPEVPGRPLTGAISLAQGRQRSDGSRFPRGDEKKQRDSKCRVAV